MKLYEDYEIQRKWNEAVEKCNNLLQELTDEEWYSYINEFLILDAHSSNAIEGNSYTLKETTNLIKYDETANNKTFKEASDIISYREASIYCLNYNGKINSNFLKELHYLVYGKARGSDDYKKRENWIGGKFITGREIKTASPEDVPLLMDNLLLFINDGIHKYINNFSNPKDLFYFLALTHARFESIHPFTDGNGRTGRLLNIAITQRLNFLPFYIDFKNRKKYIDGLSYYREHKKYSQHAIDPLASFFLNTSLKQMNEFINIFDNSKEKIDEDVMER